MAKRDGGRGSAPDPPGGAYDALPNPLVGWGGDTPPRSHPAQRLRRFDSRAFGARYSAHLAPRILHLWRSILAFRFLLIYEMPTGVVIAFFSYNIVRSRWTYCRRCPEVHNQMTVIGDETGRTRWRKMQDWIVDIAGLDNGGSDMTDGF